MNPIVINITNLVGTIVVIGEKKNASAKIQGIVNDALLRVLENIPESVTKKDPSRAYDSARNSSKG